jgi:hypothetical protein
MRVVTIWLPVLRFQDKQSILLQEVAHFLKEFKKSFISPCEMNPLGYTETEMHCQINRRIVHGCTIKVRNLKVQRLPACGFVKTKWKKREKQRTKEKEIKKEKRSEKDRKGIEKGERRDQGKQSGTETRKEKRGAIFEIRKHTMWWYHI